METDKRVNIVGGFDYAALDSLRLKANVMTWAEPQGPDLKAQVEEMFFRADEATRLKVAAATASANMFAALEEMTGYRDRLLIDLQNASGDLTMFKNMVRDKAIEVAASEHWCDEGVDAVLVELGLEPVEREKDWKVTGTVTFTREVSWTVRARTADEADEAMAWLLEDEGQGHASYDTELKIDDTSFEVMVDE